MMMMMVMMIDDDDDDDDDDSRMLQRRVILNYSIDAGWVGHLTRDISLFFWGRSGGQGPGRLGPVGMARLRAGVGGTGRRSVIWVGLGWLSQVSFYSADKGEFKIRVTFQATDKGEFNI